MGLDSVAGRTNQTIGFHHDFISNRQSMAVNLRFEFYLG